MVDVQPLFDVTSVVEPDQSSKGHFTVNFLRNLSSSVVQLTQVSTVSPSWSSSPVVEGSLYVQRSTHSPQLLTPVQAYAFWCTKLQYLVEGTTVD